MKKILASLLLVIVVWVGNATYDYLNPNPNVRCSEYLTYDMGQLVPLNPGPGWKYVVTKQVKHWSGTFEEGRECGWTGDSK